MIDLHSHITFGLDDGPITIDESIEMAKIAFSEGIRKIVATPHNLYSSNENTREVIEENVNLINDEVKRNQLPLKILIGQEISLFEGIEKHIISSNKLVSLNDTSYILVNFPESTIPIYVDQLFYDLLLNGITPIIANPEKNLEIVNNPQKLYRLVRNGALSQVETKSISGGYGKKVQKVSFQFLEYGLGQFIGSNAHTKASFKWRSAINIITEQFGEQMVNQLTSNSEDLLNNNPLNIRQPERLPKKKLFGVF